MGTPKKERQTGGLSSSSVALVHETLSCPKTELD